MCHPAAPLLAGSSGHAGRERARIRGGTARKFVIASRKQTLCPGGRTGAVWACAGSMAADCPPLLRASQASLWAVGVAHVSASNNARCHLGETASGRLDRHCAISAPRHTVGKLRKLGRAAERIVVPVVSRFPTPSAAIPAQLQMPRQQRTPALVRSFAPTLQHTWVAVNLSVVSLIAPVAHSQSTTLVTLSSAGNQANQDSGQPSISRDGRRVAFISYATNLVGNTPASGSNVYVRDLASGTTELVSIGISGSDANSEAARPTLSADGRFVAFESDASNLVSGDTNAVSDIFVRDTLTGATVRTSVTANGAQGAGPSYYASLSGDGQLVAFQSETSNFAPSDTNNQSDVFVKNLATGDLTLASITLTGTSADGASFEPSISGDGRWLAFSSSAANLISADQGGAIDIFVRDLSGGTTELISISSSGQQANQSCATPSISDDGRFVAFTSGAWNLVQGDTNGLIDVFVRDRATATTIRASVNSSGVQSNDHLRYPAISGTGRFIAFEGDPTNFGMTSGNHDIYLRDLMASITVPINVTVSGSPPSDGSAWSSVSGDGRRVAFVSRAGNLVQNDGNARADVFVREWPNCYQDLDADGFGSTNDFILHGGSGCPSGYAPNATDCDDANPLAHPGATEISCSGADEDCDGAIDESNISTYCTAGTTVHGCVPSIAGVGAASSQASSGFDIVVRNTPGQRFGTIFYGFYAGAVPWAPFSPSFQCIAFPIQRTGDRQSGGTAGQCNGELRLDFNAWRAGNPGALGSPYVAGQVIFAQGWFRDPGAPKQTNLSDGLRFTLCD
jgi:Tol biopolymer transport system component